MGTIHLPRLLTPAVVKAVRANLHHCFTEWVVAERRRAPPDLLATLQAAYDRANEAYHEAMDRAEREGVPIDDT